jgi:hypothetical protein
VQKGRPDGTKKNVKKDAGKGYDQRTCKKGRLDGTKKDMKKAVGKDVTKDREKRTAGRDKKECEEGRRKRM